MGTRWVTWPTLAGLITIVPVTVLVRSKLVSLQMYFWTGSWLPGQTQWARSLTSVPSAQTPRGPVERSWGR